jgi:hypothetical protein
LAEEVGRHQSLDSIAGALALEVDLLLHELSVQCGLDTQALGVAADGVTRVVCVFSRRVVMWWIAQCVVRVCSHVSM